MGFNFRFDVLGKSQEATGVHRGLYKGAYFKSVFAKCDALQRALNESDLDLILSRYSLRGL